MAGLVPRKTLISQLLSRATRTHQIKYQIKSNVGEIGRVHACLNGVRMLTRNHRQPFSAVLTNSGQSSCPRSPFVQGGPISSFVWPEKEWTLFTRTGSVLTPHLVLTSEEHRDSHDHWQIRSSNRVSILSPSFPGSRETSTIFDWFHHFLVQSLTVKVIVLAQNLLS